MVQKKSNDSWEQKKAKKQNQETKNDSSFTSRSEGPNHPST